MSQLCSDSLHTLHSTSTTPPRLPPFSCPALLKGPASLLSFSCHEALKPKHNIAPLVPHGLHSSSSPYATFMLHNPQTPSPLPPLSFHKALKPQHPLMAHNPQAKQPPTPLASHTRCPPWAFLKPSQELSPKLRGIYAYKFQYNKYEYTCKYDPSYICPKRFGITHARSPAR